MPLPSIMDTNSYWNDEAKAREHLSAQAPPVDAFPGQGGPGGGPGGSYGRAAPGWSAQRQRIAARTPAHRGRESAAGYLAGSPGRRTGPQHLPGAEPPGPRPELS